MSKDNHSVPETRTWRDIPQQVRPRAMSREGRRRLTFGSLRATVGAVVLGSVAWGAWEMAQVLREDPSAIPGAARSDRVRSLVLVTDGVLDRNWLARTLAVPADATLMSLDLAQLRSPVARLMAQSGGDAARMLLVSRDGVAFAGTGFDPAMVASLPWIDGVKLV